MSDCVIVGPNSSSLVVFVNNVSPSLQSGTAVPPGTITDVQLRSEQRIYTSQLVALHFYWRVVTTHHKPGLVTLWSLACKLY